ncbi:MAG: DNA polymerase III subunit delta [Chloroflexi bacterium]|nr:DNA polymerase III subunit delta [Chloroflexota bacterium]
MTGAPQFYIFHGDDSISRDEALARMRESMGEDGDLNRSEFDGAQTPVPEVLAAVKSMPFLADKRLVIVRGLISHITRRGAGQAGKIATDRLIAELPGLPDHARLVLVEDGLLSENNRLLKAAGSLENGFIRAFSKPKNLTRWISARARSEYAADITPQAAAAIASVVSDDLLRADNEICKLAAYVNGERPISEEDVAALTPYVPEANVFEMVDALAAGNGARALELIQQSLHDDPRDPGFRLFGLIVRQFRLLLMTRDHIASGGGSQAQTIAKTLGVHPFTAGKLPGQARRFTTEQLDAILKHLQRYDQDMKTGRIQPRLALDLLAASLASERPRPAS